MLLIVALCSSYYLQVKKIRAVHETVVSIFAGMVVGLIIRLSPGHLIREMLVSFMVPQLWSGCTSMRTYMPLPEMAVMQTCIK